jgi:hypothetical protein
LQAYGLKHDTHSFKYSEDNKHFKHSEDDEHFFKHPEDDKRGFFKLLISEVAHQTSEWRQIAINLDIDPVKIDQISRSRHSIPDCFIDVFKIWHDQMKHPFNWKTIIDILDVVEEHYLAKTLREKYLQ